MRVLLDNRMVRTMVERVPCRMCRAIKGKPCVSAGAVDRTDGYRRTNPHQLRINDATRDL